MKNVLLAISLILSFISPAFSQEPISVHELHKKEFGSQQLKKSPFNEDGSDIIPLQPNRTQTSTAVFGYLPDWEYASAKSYLQYDLLTHLACFDFPADTLGRLKNPNPWPWTDVINQAHLHGVKVIMCVTNFTGSQINKIISVASSKQNLFSNIKNTIKQYSLDGVNIDFEGLNKADRGSLINSFMAELTDTIHAAFPGKEVSFAGPVINWGGWDLLGLAKACDYIFIMGYSFYGGFSSTSGPCAPLTGSSQTNNITSALASATYGYGAVIPNYANKLILGVPYYGNSWLVRTSSSYSKAVDYIRSTFYRDNVLKAPVYGLNWDSKSSTPWYCYQQDTLWVQNWFDTDTSTGLKYNLAASKNLKGIGMWALGYDGSRQELWDLLRQRVISDVKSTESHFPSGFALSQNYPNPFNPSTVINYEVPRTASITLAVYDLLGREIAVLAEGEKAPGSYSVRFDGSNLPGGVYFYRLESAGLNIARKFILLK
ncbi:MAG TPA: glycosyl hydrolase family 18 protein [Ignavibacteriales bacterium]|nr:glycosyl hydrolase family 18 protein [Ignavibacteriales bacterium]